MPPAPAAPAGGGDSVAGGIGEVRKEESAESAESADSAAGPDDSAAGTGDVEPQTQVLLWRDAWAGTLSMLG